MAMKNVKLDPYTIAELKTNIVGKKNKIIIKIDRIFESDDLDKVVPYTKPNLEKYWLENNSPDIYLKIVETEQKGYKRYFILDNINNLLYIPLTNKDKNIVDYATTNLSYLIRVIDYNFYRDVSRTGKKYVKCNIGSMHEIIFGEKAGRGYKLDHINSNGLDNRRENLRKVTDRENSLNLDTDNRLIGCCWRPKYSQWEAMIKVNGIQKSLGRFENKLDAIKQYDKIAIHLYGEIKQLNQIDGKIILTEDEIQEVKNNPQKYHDFLYRQQIKDAKRVLPKNIRQSTTSSGYTYYKGITKFFISEELAFSYLENFKNSLKEYNVRALINCEVKHDSNKNKYFFTLEISKSFQKLEDTISFAKRVKEEIADKDQLQREKLEKEIDQHRNEDGIAFLKMKNSDDTYSDVMVIDEDWLDFVHYSWHNNGKGDGYPTNSDLGDLHIVILKKHFPIEYDNRKDDETVDHKNRNVLDATIQNLRLAGSSLQSQNRIVNRNSLVPYTGVHAVQGGFYALYKKERSNVKYETAEEASAKYNEMAFKDNAKCRLNIIPDKKTRIVDIFGIENLKQINIDDIKALADVKEIFRINQWHKGLNDMRLKDIKKYKEIIKEKIK